MNVHFNVMDILESEGLGSLEPLGPPPRRRAPVWALEIRNVEHLPQRRPEPPPLQTHTHEMKIIM